MTISSADTSAADPKGPDHSRRCSDLAAGHAGPSRPGFQHEDLYASPPPWDIGHPQPALQVLTEQGVLRGRVLDVGCGTGEHALMAAALGLDATGIDLASNALHTAEQKARARGLKARFLRYDALNLAELGEVFDTVLDCGLFHIFSDGERAIYVDGLRAVLKSGGRYFHLGFSDHEPGNWENRRVRKLTQAEIAAAFSDGWHIDSIEPATIESTIDSRAIRAWLVAAIRV